MNSENDFGVLVKEDVENINIAENDAIASAEVDAFFDKKVFYGFKVGDFGLLIDYGVDSEVIDNMPIYSLPNTSTWLQGVINLRGHLIPVFDLQSLFDFSHDSQKKDLLLILDKGEKAVAIKITEHPEALDNLDIDTQPVHLPDELKDHVLEIFKKDQMNWLKYDKEQFFKALSPKIIASKETEPEHDE
ncbi:MAG: chemotaxis protein CheW [Methylococcales bacterium]|nr:chemotaxis protein CheW [Methylococcales bacterium]